MKKRVDILAGQFGWPLSYGLKSGLGSKLDPEVYEVHYWLWKQHREVASELWRHQLNKRAIIGFSLGANALSWIANEYHSSLDLIVAYDPSVQADLYPISYNVKRCIVHRQMGYFFTSAIYGRATFTRTQSGPRIEENRFTADHLAVPYLSSLHSITRKALEEM